MSTLTLTNSKDATVFSPEAHHLTAGNDLQSHRERKTSPLSLDGAQESGLARTQDSLRAQDTRRGRKEKERLGGRRKKGAWKKLLWVKQSYPDNYTDEYTFLDHLQRNPRLQPYEFWHLVADSTVIVQHVASVVIFICCFSGIFQERVSPVSVVGWASFVAVLGWVLWDSWCSQEEKSIEAAADGNQEEEDVEEVGKDNLKDMKENTESNLASGKAAEMAKATDSPRRSSMRDSPSKIVGSSLNAPDLVGHPTGASTFAIPPYGIHSSSLSPRNQQRLATMKSAILIYFAVLGLSPILKSLTKSTSSDSIWAMSAWLMAINIFFFDYGGSVGAKFPASLSTNAALMASTVLASRLKSTTHVFSLTLFSIEVFGLFPVFRRHLRHMAWQAHLLLTALLVVGASGGLSVIISGGAWKAALIGGFLGTLLTVLAMGVCSWWLIDLQKYKNEIHGPWDPARPVIRRRWD